MLEIDRMLTLSTAHVNPHTGGLIDEYLRRREIEYDGDIEQNFDGLSVYPKADYGWFIYIGDAKDDAAIFAKLPADLQNVIEFTLDQDCLWLCLDRDGEATDGLPTFDW
jgi:hypothetical protein